MAISLTWFTLAALLAIVLIGTASLKWRAVVVLIVLLFLAAPALVFSLLFIRVGSVSEVSYVEHRSGDQHSREVVFARGVAQNASSPDAEPLDATPPDAATKGATADLNREEGIDPDDPDAEPQPASAEEPDETNETVEDEPAEDESPRLVEKAGRPAWIAAPRVRSQEVDTEVVTAGPYSTRGECDRALDEAMLLATRDYVDDYLDQPAAAERIGVNLDFVRRHALADTHNEEIVVSIGPMRQGHALLEFDEEFRQEIRHRWQQALVTLRLGMIGLISVGVVGLLGLVYGLLRYDTSTRGYYSRRLQYAGATAGVVIVALLVGMLTAMM